jgi:hypothetical protein
MHLTGHELTAASSAVAAIAIVGGYLGVRSANRNAVRIAREERRAQEKHELALMKKAVYAQYQSALNQLALAAQRMEFMVGAGTGIPGERMDDEARDRQQAYDQARVRALDARAEVELLADELLAALGRQVFEITQRRSEHSRADYDSRRFDFLQAMKADLGLSMSPAAGEARSGHCGGLAAGCRRL